MELYACPMDGGGVVDIDGRVLTAWRRDETVFLARPGQAEMAIGKGKDVALASGQKGILIAWTDPEWNAHLIRRILSSLRTAEGSLALARLSNGNVLAAWEQGGSIFTQVLR